MRAVSFGLAAITLFALLLLPMAMARHFDLSVFILAGDKVVDPAKVPAPITVGRHFQGSDGQFFYRLAVDPWSFEQTADGVTLDLPAKRMQRIVYPVTVWLVSLGRPGLVPAGMLAVNLLGIGVIAAGAAWLQRRHGLRPWLPFAILAWPGVLISLTHDTAEIVDTALLLTALACFWSGRLWAFAALAAAAALTRETTAPVWVGLLAFEAYRAATSPPATRLWSRVWFCAVPFVPFGLWWLTQSVAWGHMPQSLLDSPDLGWPLLGVGTMLWETVNDLPVGDAEQALAILPRTFVMATSLGLIGFCATVLGTVPHLVRARSPATGLAVGWLLMLVLLSLLTARGPWVDPHAYFRAFTECWVVGCLLLAFRPADGVRRSRLAPWLFAAAAVEVNAIMWIWSREILP